MPFIIISAISAFIILMIFVRCGSLSDTVDNVEVDQKNHLGDPLLRKIQTYFFTDNNFDFEKFSDYIICIKDNMNINEYAEILLELDMMIKLSSQLKDRIVMILIYDEKLDEFSYKNFKEIRNNLREGKYKGTYRELVDILITTILYLKHEMKILKSK